MFRYPRPVYFVRAALWTAGCVLAPAVLGSAGGRRWGTIGVLVALAATAWLLLWLPRSAHGAFTAARFDRAGRWYRLLGVLAFTRARARSAHLSRVGCEVAAGRHDRADALLATVDAAALEPAERVVWLNNRACRLLDRKPGEGRARSTDAPAALALADEAIALRPDVPAVQHTRARALLAVDRVDDAIAVLDAMRAGGELAPWLEAERCRDLASAWERKGQVEYARDYRERARLVARDGTSQRTPASGVR